MTPPVEDRPESAASLAKRLRELRGEHEPVARVVSTTLRISSDPSGARVSHRSRLVPGATPLSLTLRDDELPATITVTAPEHHPRDVTIESTTPDEVASVDVEQNRLRLQTLDGDVAEMVLHEGLWHREHRAWVEETVRGEFERHRQLREVDGG